MSENVLAWHFTNGNKLRDGRTVPPIGEWLRYDGDVVMCESGLHSSRKVFDASKYAPGNMLHRVECRNVVEEQDDKLVCRERRILASIDAEPLLRAFARFCAWTVLPMWDAPDIVVQWIMSGDENIQAPARDAAEPAAESAAEPAARYAAWDAARYAAWSAAESAAESAAWDALAELLEQAALDALKGEQP